MKIAVTGGHGFLGSALIEELLSKGHKVFNISRSAKNKDDIAYDIKNQTIDLEKLDAHDVDVIIHLAGEGIAEKKWSDKQKDEILKSRIESTDLLTDAISKLQNKPSLFICASAIGYYGTENREVLDERGEAGDDFLAEVCKLWEDHSQVVKTSGVKVANIRTGIVLDPAGGTLKKLLLPFKLGMGGRLGKGDQMMSWITRNDWVRAVTFIAEKELEGPFNLVAPVAVSNKQFTKALGDALHRPTLLPTPLLPLKVLYGKELVESLLLGSQNLIPKALIENGFTFEQEDIDTAFKTILK